MIIRNLCKYYHGKCVVDNVSLELPEGKVISFIGPNGAGKSTVLNMISRLLGIDKGEVFIEGKELRDWKSADLAKKLAILTQTNNIQSKITVRELISFGRFPYCQGRLGKDDLKIIEQSIAFMELDAFADRFLDELSGGQRQRALIAMVLSQDTKYVLLDEPTNNLDIYHSSRLMRTVRRLCDELGKTVIMVLHEINYASFYSDYICAFKDGKVARFGTVDEIMRPNFLKEIYKVDFSITTLRGKPLTIYF